MVWIEPITTWNSTDEYSASDWNRVVNDTQYLLQMMDMSAVTPNVTAPAFWRLSRWSDVKEILIEINDTLGTTYETPSDTVTAQDVNKMEALLVLAKRKLEQLSAQLYTGEPYAGDFETYAG